MESRNSDRENSLDLLQDRAFQCFALWSAVLCVKTLILPLYSGFYRFYTGTFINPEDAILPNTKSTVGDGVVNEKIERIRSAHMNDLENIPIFVVTGLAYVCTYPNWIVATTLFALYGVCRIAHTMFYAVFALRQPSRAVVFWIGWGVNVYMAAAVLWKQTKLLF